MGNFFHACGAIAFSLLTLASVHTHHVAVNNHHDNDTRHEDKNVQMVQATGSISKFGQTINLSMTFPRNGGEVNGNITGACSGPIHGSFDRKSDQKGTMKGFASADCTVLFTTIEGSATFHGFVNLEDKSISLDTDVSGDGMHQDTLVTLVTN